MATSVEDLLNQALRAIGYPTPIGSIYEGSRASRIGVEIYGQTRDELLRTGNWPFARQAVALVALKTAPVGGYGASNWTNAYPPPPWVYEYAYPTACLDIRSVRPVPIMIPEMNPVTHRFIVASDPSVEPSKVVLTNLGNAQAVITAQVTDPTAWESSFSQALIDALALQFQQALSPGDAEKMRAAQAAQADAEAETRRG
jgi:hypothetical protein